MTAVVYSYAQVELEAPRLLPYFQFSLHLQEEVCKRHGSVNHAKPSSGHLNFLDWGLKRNSTSFATPYDKLPVLQPQSCRTLRHKRRDATSLKNYLATNSVNPNPNLKDPIKKLSRL